MRTIRWWVEMDLQGSEQSGEIEIEDDATDEEIEGAVREEVFQHVEWGWSEADGEAAVATEVLKP